MLQILNAILLLVATLQAVVQMTTTLVILYLSCRNLTCRSRHTLQKFLVLLPSTVIRSRWMLRRRRRKVLLLVVSLAISRQFCRLPLFLINLLRISIFGVQSLLNDRLVAVDHRVMVLLVLHRDKRTHLCLAFVLASL